jgi:AcrR family transcriptional regulator
MPVSSDASPRGRRGVRPSGDDRELAILATAERLLAERPLGAISVDDLARGAGISRPTFYFYFASKDAVLLSLLDRVVDEADTVTREAFGHPASGPREGWRRVITAYYETFRAHRALTLAWAEARSSNPEIRGLWARDRRRAGPRSGARRTARPRPGRAADLDQRAGALRHLQR